MTKGRAKFNSADPEWCQRRKAEMGRKREEGHEKEKKEKKEEMRNEK